MFLIEVSVTSFDITRSFTITYPTNMYVCCSCFVKYALYTSAPVQVYFLSEEINVLDTEHINDFGVVNASIDILYDDTFSNIMAKLTYIKRFLSAVCNYFNGIFFLIDKMMTCHIEC